MKLWRQTNKGQTGPELLQYGTGKFTGPGPGLGQFLFSVLTSEIWSQFVWWPTIAFARAAALFRSIYMYIHVTINCHTAYLHGS